MAIELDERGRALENEYFRRQEQELIQKLKTKIAGENKTLTDRDCPKCDGKLIETDYENIKIDVCGGCQGVWLDAGEMAQILQKDEAEGGGGWFGRVFK